jgi:hypothetical protein
MFVAGQGLSAPRDGASTPDYKQLAEARVAAGSDWVKVYGSRGSYQSVDTTQTLTFDEMKSASTPRMRRIIRSRFTPMDRRA